jgi:hypothetical protein
VSTGDESRAHQAIQALSPVGLATSDARDPDNVSPSIVEVCSGPVTGIDRSQGPEDEGAADRPGMLGDLRSRLDWR